MAGKDLVVGPWGGQGGEAWSYVPKGAITHISITYGDIIYSIRFTSQDKSGKLHLSDQFGSHEGTGKAEIDIDAKVENLSGISGTFGMFSGLLLVTSLSFTTDKNKSYGPFGPANGTAFSYEVKDESIIGFNGRSGWHLDSIGVHLKLKKKLVAAEWGGQGGNSWKYKPKGKLSHVSVSYDDVIHTIQFTSRDDSGKTALSDQFGRVLGNMKDEIEIDTKVERLSSISGTFGMYDGLQLVTSLSFTTDTKKSYGPMGDPNGIAFSFEEEGESIIGFHGRSGNLLDAIGVIVKPIE